MNYRKILLHSLAAFGFLTLTGCSACTEQHDPSRDHAKFKEESHLANQTLPSLKEDGSLPDAPKVVEAAGSQETASTENEGTKKFGQFCAACHGADGSANGPVAAAMNPKPRNFTNATWQASVDDAHIAKVIKEGGASVGLSPTMAPWGAVLSDEEIKQVVALIRSLKK